jgi:hypothetical protein
MHYPILAVWILSLWCGLKFSTRLSKSLTHGLCLDLSLRVTFVESILRKTVLQQVGSGYFLAIPWWVASAPSSSDCSHTISG